MNRPLKPWLLKASEAGLVGSVLLRLDDVTAVPAADDCCIARNDEVHGSAPAASCRRALSRIGSVSATPGCTKPCGLTVEWNATSHPLSSRAAAGRATAASSPVT